MINSDAPDNVEADNSIVMYIIVRESLNMSIGKTAAQCAHASQMLMVKYYEEVKSKSNSLQWQIKSVTDSPAKEDLLSLYKELAPQISIMGEWLKLGVRKVTLKADDKEWVKLKSELNENQFVLVIDAGLTEIAAGSETVIGLWPIRKNDRSKLIKRLQVLK